MRMIFPRSHSFICIADVAQQVERLIRNQKVGGSTPPIGSLPPLSCCINYNKKNYGNTKTAKLQDMAGKDRR